MEPAPADMARKRGTGKRGNKHAIGDSSFHEQSVMLKNFAKVANSGNWVPT